ncbi:MAG: phosphatase PAP2 family protein [Actinomycetota bacterium]|nr:phosphatase PAP2 family protein [Actinomycetota bacterium]
MFVALSLVGYAGLVWIVLAPLLARWAGRPVTATTATTAAAVWTADLLATALKVAVDRPRPFERLGEAEPLLGGTVGASFPSGHAATSFAGAVALALLARRAVPALFLLAALVAFSRVYVGVHYPLDILGGAALGAAVAPVVVLAVRLPRSLSADRRRSGEPRPSG